ncbi:MAG: alpha/beta hydrolase, partial [Gemmatimonadota bacterium]|nr:alpha/beta hydrolase [Gemmatimonadota bacterium]
APAPALAFDLTSETRRIGDLLEALGDAHPTGPGGAGPVVPAVIAGHSQGAAIALSWAADAASPPALLLSNPVTPWTRRPLALGALESGLMRALIAGIFSPLRRPLAAAILRRAAGPEYRVPPDVIDAYAAPYADRARAATLMAVLRDWHPAQLEGRLPVAGPPAHVLAGSRDPRIAPDTARRLAERLGAGFTLVGDGGHVLPEQHPRLLAEELERILDVLGTAPVTGR